MTSPENIPQEPELLAFDPMPISLEAVANEAAKHTNVCVTCNTSDQALRVFRAWQKAGLEDAFLMGGKQSPNLFANLIEAIKIRQDRGMPVHVASTPCLDSGVNLDFEHYWRAITDLPNICQASGRHNRHGTSPFTPLHVFVPDDAIPECVPPEMLTEMAANAMASGQNAPSRIKAYRKQMLLLTPVKGPDGWTASIVRSKASRIKYDLDAGAGIRLIITESPDAVDNPVPLYDIELTRAVNGSTETLWSDSHVPVDAGESPKAIAYQRAVNWLDEEARKLRNIRRRLDEASGTRNGDNT